MRIHISINRIANYWSFSVSWNPDDSILSFEFWRWELAFELLRSEKNATE